MVMPTQLPTIASRRRRFRLQETTAEVDWTLALAGGDGVRLADYVAARFGRRVPKQYCALLGERTMLQHTLDRLHAIAPPSRTLTVIGTHHAEIAMPQLAGRCDHVFRQPSSRDTGVAVYVALAMIRRWAPNAIVTITPTDHYVFPVGEVRRAGAPRAPRRGADAGTRRRARRRADRAEL